MVSTRLTVAQFLSIVELRTKIISVATFVAGTLYAVLQTDVFSPWVTLLMFLAVLFVDMATTAFNNFFDYLRGTDVADYNVEENKVLLHQGVAPGWALVIALICYILAAVLGVAIAYLRGWWIIPVGAVCMLVGYFYTGGPRPIATTPFGELFAGGFLGMVLFLLSAAVQTPPGSDLLTAWVVVGGLPPFFTIAAILAVNNSCDREGDGAAGRRTFAVLVGERVSRVYVYLLAALAHVALVVLVIFDKLPVPAAVPIVLSAVFAAVQFRKMDRRGYTFETKGPNMVAILKVYLVQSAMYVASLVSGLFLR
ncbi:MAG: prenyltransferase [bacterium]